MYLYASYILPLLSHIVYAAGGVNPRVSITQRDSRKTCTVQPSGTNATDDTPAIVEAFQECGRGGTVQFLNSTYYVNSVMNITWLDDCEIDLQGTLLV